MAIPITKKVIKELPVIQYEKIRDHLKSGHIFFSSGSYLFSGSKQRLTKSAWSHAAIVYTDEELGRVMILESEPQIGIRLNPLSKNQRNNKGEKTSLQRPDCISPVKR